MVKTIDVVEFEIGGTRYALDILMAREIVEMIPITPVPLAPPYIAGIINLRGEITNIINLNTLLQLPDRGEVMNRKIIVLVPEVAGGSNLGIIVDDVHSVMQVSEDDVETMDATLCHEAFVKGIIKIGEDGGDDAGAKGLVIWIDMTKVLGNLTAAV
ncbi:MAG: chemotaxis protein CheW [Methanofollis sp.]|uniref:chemotaxis protein CheW n=1 Tax=Methanofollis sp. TaxID=2052835 RepID=UPI0026016880|nr:chemotaxis protein CheW [Methanofollis sp.]MDD4256070.1 chemotaxis protein CheW [Methanofollis sp.]